MKRCLTAIIAIITINIVREVSAGACAAGTYNDGYATFDSSRYFTIASPTIQLMNGVNFTIEAWARRATSDLGTTSHYIGVGPVTGQGTRNYLHVGWRASNVFSFSFWGDDFDGGGSTNNNNWHHWAYVYDATKQMRYVFKDGGLISQLASGGQLTAATPQPWKIGGIASGTTDKFVGDLDEIMVFDRVLPSATILAHYNGDYFGWLTAGAGCLLYFKFNEGTGLTAVDSITGGVNNAVWTPNAGWGSNTNTPTCVPGFWNGWKIVVPVASLRYEKTATVNVYLLDNHNNLMIQPDYPTPPSPTTVSVTLIGARAGTGLPTSPFVVTLTDGQGSFTLTATYPQTLTFSLTDTGNYGRSTTITSPTLSFVGGDLTAVLLSSVNNPNITYTPNNIEFGVYFYNAASVTYAIASINVVATFKQTLTITVNSGDISFMTPGSPFAIDLIQGVNTIQLVSTEDGTYTYTWSITRLGPDLTSIQLAANPAVTSISPAFAQANFVPRNVAIPGILTTLSVTTQFSIPTSVTLTMNGVSFGVMVPNTAVDVSSAIAAGSNLLRVTSTADGGSFDYTLGTACPVPYKCTPAPPNSNGCEFYCQYCTGATFRSICMHARPTCCGDPGCKC